MKELVPWILWAWALLSPLAFRFLPGRDAAIGCLVLGWTVLPVAPYPEASLVDAGFKSSLPALAIPTALLVNKGTAIGLGCLLGIALFDRRTLERLRFDRVDGPMAVWCLVPLASCPWNGLPLAEGLAQARYLAIAWGVPYLMGRAYLADPGSRARFAVALAAGGLAWVPLCLIEIGVGPMVYHALYGPHAYEFEGASRFLGSRPLVFSEHGNQLGVWMASSALSAAWLWASGALKKPGGIPGGLLASILIAVTVLCQSHASIVLLGGALAVLWLGRNRPGSFPWRILLASLVGIAILGAGLEGARRGFNPSAIRQDVAGFFQGIHKQSFTWRLARSAELLPVVAQHPILGWGRADWVNIGEVPFINPVNLPLEVLALGMYGIVGGLALPALWLLPIVGSIRRNGGALLGPRAGSTGALVAVSLLHFLDGLSNATLVLPILAALGGLNRPSDRSD